MNQKHNERTGVILDTGIRLLKTHWRYMLPLGIAWSVINVCTTSYQFLFEEGTFSYQVAAVVFGLIATFISMIFYVAYFKRLVDCTNNQTYELKEDLLFGLKKTPRIILLAILVILLNICFIAPIGAISAYFLYNQHLAFSLDGGIDLLTVFISITIILFFVLLWLIFLVRFQLVFIPAAIGGKTALQSVKHTWQITKGGKALTRLITVPGLIFLISFSLICLPVMAVISLPTMFFWPLMEYSFMEMFSFLVINAGLQCLYVFNVMLFSSVLFVLYQTLQDRYTTSTLSA